MASNLRSRRAAEPRSGGKIVRARRTAAARTPYDRPRPANPAPQNPNWLSRLIYSPTRLIATGAGKLLSTVFSPESSSSSSSASSSGGSDTSLQDDIDMDNDDNDISSLGANGLIQKDETSEMIKCFRKEPQPAVGKSDTKRVIEQLLMQETFSREECNRLTMIIESRVVYCPATENADGRSSEILNATVGSEIDMPALCTTAVMEAKKWLKEKKLTNSKSELDHGTCTLNSIMMPPGAEDEVGSPVDMAKLYMRARPPWASPSVNNIESKSPSPIGMQLFKEDTPYSIDGNLVSSSKLKRDSPATGSWNIQEEIRRVRSKATEEMLRTLPSSKIDWSAFALEHKSSPSSLAAEELEAGKGDNVNNSKQPIDASLNLATGPAKSHGFPVLEMTQDGLQKEASLHNPAIIVSEQNQDLEAIQIIEGKEGLQDGIEQRLISGERIQSLEDTKTLSPGDAGADNVDGLKDTNGTNQQHNSIVGGAISDSTLHDGNCLTSNEVAGTGSVSTTNGFPGSSLSAGRDTDQNPVPFDEEHDQVGPSDDKVAAGSPLEETCEFFSEASIEVPNINEKDGVSGDSQNNSSTHYEELSEDLSQPNPKQGVAGKTGSIVEKQLGKKMTRYNRRGRGRGRGRGN